MNRGEHKRDRDKFRIMPDGREICSTSQAGKVEYRRRRDKAWDRDRGRCCLCHLPVSLEECTLEHLKSRGMNGSKRDDRLENLGVSHWYGNNAKGSQSMERYMLLPLEERIRLCKGI